jgi:hypothetical protein
MIRKSGICIGSILLALGLLGGCSDDTVPPKPDKGPAQDVTVPKEAAPASCVTTAYAPASDKVGDYKLDGAIKIAADSTALKDLIDGGSEKYEQNKFVCMSLAKYTSASKSVSVELWIFDQTDVGGATAAMGAVVGPDDTDLAPVLGDAAKENLKLPFGYTAIFRKGKVLGRVILEKDKAIGQADALALLQAAVAAVP